MKKLFGRDKTSLKRTSFDEGSRPYQAVSGSHSSSFTSLPLGGSPSIPNTFSSRATSPYSFPPFITSQTKPYKERDREQQLLHKTPPSGAAGAIAAVGILRALDPHSDTEQHARDPPEDGLSHYEPSIREDKRERKAFWERTSGKEREKDHDREGRERERRDEDGQGELTRMIGYLTKIASEDWDLVLDVCDRASTSESNAKEAVKALKREFKYAGPPAQLSAARLWAIMLRNSSQTFIRQSTSRKFLDTIETVLENPRTSSDVRERLLDVVAAAAHGTVTKNERDKFRVLWRKVKPIDKPDDGVPFDPGNAMFNPPIQRIPHIAENRYETLASPQPGGPGVISSHTNHQVSSRNRVISLEEDIRRLFQECKVGRGNATLLSEALMFAKPEDLKEQDIIKEFYVRCRASQELIFAQIPWATAGAERSRIHNIAPSEKSHPNVLQVFSPPSSVNNHANGPPEVTTEERLLAALLGANEDLLEALRMYDDFKIMSSEKEEWNKIADVAAHPNQSNATPTNTAEPLNFSSLESGVGTTSSSGTPSPTPSPVLSTPAPVPVIPPLISQAKPNHPIPLTPAHPQSLAPPPPAPHGPRLPSPNFPRSRSSSPEVPAPAIDDIYSRKHRTTMVDIYETAGDGDEYDDTHTPLGLSEKALGKRRVADNDDIDRHSDTGDSFFGTGQEATYSSDSLDVDSNDLRTLWQQPVRYVYDAAAERTQERIKCEMSSLVKEVH